MGTTCTICGRYYSGTTCPCTKRTKTDNPNKCYICKRGASVAPYNHGRMYIIPELTEKRLYCTQCYYEMEYIDSQTQFKQRINGELVELQADKDRRSKFLIRSGSNSTFWSKATAMEKEEAKQYYKRFGRPAEPTLEVVI